MADYKYDQVPPLQPGIWMGGMNGLNVTRIISNVAAGFLTFDPSSQLLFWVESRFVGGSSSETLVYDIVHGSVDGKSRSRTIGLTHPPIQLRVAGSRLFWLHTKSFPSRGAVISCEKLNGSHLRRHKLNGQEGNISVDFLIIPAVSSEVDAKGGDHICNPAALCSHICVPSVTGYMRCLCPWGYRLKPDGWTCGEQRH